MNPQWWDRPLIADSHALDERAGGVRVAREDAAAVLAALAAAVTAGAPIAETLTALAGGGVTDRTRAALGRGGS